jgi:glycosyltransferase 2 family protein
MLPAERFCYGLALLSRRRLFVIVKVIIAGLLLGWLVRSGSLDFALLAVFFHKPALLVANLVVFLGTYLLSAVRWQLLLRSAGIDLRYGRALQLTLTATFFNVVAPGNVGGDVVKAIYVARDVAPEKRASVYLVGLLDRLLALSGLVAVAVVLNVGAQLISGGPQLGDPTIAIAVLAVITLVVPVAGLALIRRFGARFESWTSGSSRIAKLLHRVVASARLVSERPGALAIGLALSIAIHLAGILWFAAVASAVLDQDVAVAQMAAVYPLGMLSVLLPISYAGFGVGHVAFDQLFAMIGLSGGANVLNVFLIGQIVPGLFCVIPYLLLKRQSGALSEAELVSEPDR